jgi:hypothetical protein
MGRARPALCYVVRLVLCAGIALPFAACGGEPSRREVLNARAFEALLTAISLKNWHELESDAKSIDERHAAGEISDAKYAELTDMIAKARAGDWGAAEKRAYEFRTQFGDRGSYFD